MSKTPKPPDTALRVNVERYTGKDDGLSILASVTAMEVASKEDCELLLTDTKRWKQENREIESYYNNPKDGIVFMLRNAYERARDMRDDHLRPRQQAIAEAEKRITKWNSDRKRIEAEQARLERERLEREEQARRDTEAAKAEAEALKLEASSNVLSEREQKFVAKAVAGRMTIPELVYAAQVAGYKSPEQAVGRLMKSDKINTAIANTIKAQRIRDEAATKAAQPILVDVPKVESQIGSVSGTRITTRYYCQSYDVRAVLQKLAKEYGVNQALTAEVDQYLVHSTDQEKRPSALQSLMNAEARQSKQLLGKVWPGAVLGVDEGVAG